MSYYGPPSTPGGSAFPRGGPPPFRGPPPAFRGPPPAFRGPPPAFAARGPPPFALRGPPPAFRPPMGLNLPPTMATQTGASLPPGWSEYRTPQGAVYYYNAATGVSTYDRPPMMSPVAQQPPKWLEYKDEATGAFYYYNTWTKETVWDQPEEFRMQKAREQVAKMTSEALTAQPSPSPHNAPPEAVSPAIPVAESSSASTEKEDEDAEAMKRQEAQEEARRKRKEELARQEAAQFTDKSRAERMAAFKEFLADKHISAAIKWGDAQRAIAKDASMRHDPRWLFALHTVGDKKQAFAEYCTQARNRATIDKRRLVKKAREEFLELLGLFESSLAPPSRRAASWDEVSASDAFYAMRQDPRWAAIHEARERQQLFAAFMQDLERSQKARLAKRRDALRAGFVTLLRHTLESKRLSSKRLDSDGKRSVLALVRLVELPGEGPLGDQALELVDRHDVYDWTDEFLREHRQLEHARRKRERAERAERDEKLARELTAQLEELAARQELTAASGWTEFSAQHLGAEDEQLDRKTQRRLFEDAVRSLRRGLEPAAAVIRAHLDHSRDPLRVTQATSYAVFVDALESGVGDAVETNAPEEGEEEGEMRASEDAEAGGRKTLDAEQVDAALKAAVKRQRAQHEAGAVAFPACVRQVYDMWVAEAKEAGRKEEHKLRKHRKRDREESRDLGEEEDEDRPRRASADEGPEAEEKSPRKRRSHRSWRQRRRSHGSPSVSRSRSRSEGRRSRGKRSRSRSRERDALPPSLAAASSKPVVDKEATDAFPPLLRPTKPLTAEEEAAKAEEIIRQARLKLQVKSAYSDGGELEEGEEPEEGQEIQE